MSNFNLVILMGNITRDIQLSFTPNQVAVAEFGIAVNKKWKTKDGVGKEKTCFVDCRAFGKLAENINKFFSKGRPILINGELDYDTWEKDGQKKSKHRVTVNGFTFVDSQKEKAEEPKQTDDIPF